VTGDWALAVAHFGDENKPRLQVTNAPHLQAHRDSNSATVNGDYNDAYAYLRVANTATVTGEWGCNGRPVSGLAGRTNRSDGGWRYPVPPSI